MKFRDLKTGIGRLSAYCGAVSAGCGAGAGIAYLQDGSVDAVAHTVVNKAPCAVVTGYPFHSLCGMSMTAKYHISPPADHFVCQFYSVFGNECCIVLAPVS